MRRNATMGRRIAARRQQAGLTREQLAGDAGTNPARLREIEAGRTSPSVDLLAAIADVLDCSMDVIYWGRE